MTPRFFRVRISAPEPPRFLQRPSKEKLDLGVQAAQFGIGPTLERLVGSRIKPEQKGFSFRHFVWIKSYY